MVLFVLYEHAAGYAIFRCEEVEDIGSLLPEVQEAVMDFARFGSMLNLEAFGPFKSGINALENINCISEGLVHEDLNAFLMNNFPQSKKKKKSVLGVADTKLGSAIQETLEISCTSGGPVLELLRGIRLYFHKLVSGLAGPAAAQAQLGLGHSYSRAKVKFNVHRSDNMIIQSISLLDQLDKDVNTFSMRIREWYSYHFPELVKIVPDNYMYSKVVNFIGSRKNLTEDKLEALEEIVMDSTKAEAIYESAKMSMGMDIALVDLINIERFSLRVMELSEYRRKLSDYLCSKMESVAPNLTTLIGEQVGARLISHAGSLTNLAKYPASTVQILGAEKALFRALKTKGNTPKYGLIFHSSFIGRAGPKNKGRISRFLANKCSIASRIDCFSEYPTTVFGTKLKEQVEERLSFFETGATPRKNLDVMKEAMQTAEEEKIVAVDEITPKKKKKKKKRHSEVSEETEAVQAVEEALAEESMSTKKKKKKRHSEVSEEIEAVQAVEEALAEESMSTKKKKKKRHSEVSEETEAVQAVEDALANESMSAKKKKKRKRVREEEEEEDAFEQPATETPSKPKKKIKKL